MNGCDERNLLLYLDNELRGQDLRDFVAHLTGCAVSRIQLAEEWEFLDLLH
jgi:hypothetical protein